MTWRRRIRWVERLAPMFVQKIVKRIAASEFQRSLTAASTVAEKVAIATGKTPFRANQKPAEISQLLNLLAESQPRVVVEIGADRGGNLALLAQVAHQNALLISVDPVHHDHATTHIAAFAKSDQTITLIDGDSHQTMTKERVLQALAGAPIDFLFIDGDHSYEGVRDDYSMYSPLVKPEGVIAFHDIYPNAGDPNIYVGGVPEFWKELKADNMIHEFIADRNQNGYGIGVVKM